MSNISILMPENGEQTFTEKQLVKFELTDGAIQEMKEKYLPLTIAGIDDRNGFNIVHNARMIVKGKRILVEKKRKELSESAKTYISSVNNEAKRITDLLSPIEDHLEGEETRIEQARETLKREAEEREHKRIQERIDKLHAYGYGVDYSEIKTCTDIAFEGLLQEAKESYEKDIAAKAEAKRLADEEAERLKEERAQLNIMKAELERARMEQEANEAEIKKKEKLLLDARYTDRLNRLTNLCIIDDTMNMRYKSLLAIKKEVLYNMSEEEWNKTYKNSADTIRQLREQEEEEKQKFIEAEKQKAAEAKVREAQQKIEEERLAKEAIEREKALAPDREKIQDFVQSLYNINYPDVNSNEAKKIVTGSKIRIADTIAIINTWLKSSVLLAEYNESENITLVKEG